MTTQSLYPLTSSAVSRTLTLAFACVLLAACSGSDGSSSGNAFADPSTLEPGAVPVINVDVVDPGPIEFEPPVVATPDLYDTLLASGTFTRLLELIDRAGLAS
ncbi:MAG: hypothetical protein HKN42_04505, partial [Granulosicoccus sp.]|nr:hypothetical protein [Granulosicoccus sp.]